VRARLGAGGRGGAGPRLAGTPRHGALRGRRGGRRITIGWALAHYPELLPGQLSIDAAAAPHATLVALLSAVAIGLALVAPGLVALYRLTVRGEIEEPLEEIDRRFAPPPPATTVRSGRP
jgi:hypothetical protein